MGNLKLIMLLLSLISDQESPEQVIPRKNNFGVYFGLLEGNINYERIVFVFPRSYMGFRAGWGQFTNLQVEADVYNATLVYILGKRSSHLELNAGLKYLDYRNSDQRGKPYPDLFAGYRLEKPDGRVFMRIGLSGLSIVNIGGGLKF